MIFMFWTPHFLNHSTLPYLLSNPRCLHGHSVLLFTNECFWSTSYIRGGWGTFLAQDGVNCVNISYYWKMSQRWFRWIFIAFLHINPPWPLGGSSVLPHLPLQQRQRQNTRSGREEKQVAKEESWEWVGICRRFWPYGAMQTDLW